MDSSAWGLLVQGAWTTLWISGISIAIGVVMGLLIALLRVAKIPVLHQLLGVYISLARATPLVTLVLFIFLTAPTMGVNLNRNVAGIIALTLNTTAFNAEISFLIKGSPAIAVIGVVDLTRVTNRISAVTYDPLPPILAAAALYMLIISLLVWLQRVAERKASRLAV